jgi:hypothetical protein
MATDAHIERTAAYEKRDANPRALVYFILIMAAILAATSLSLIWLFKHYQKVENPGSVVAAPFAAARPLPPPPRIQPNPSADMQGYMQSQQDLLNSYGWIDRQEGVVRLPIDRAMQLLLERGLLTRPPNTPDNGAPDTRGNRSGSKTDSRGAAR